MTPITFELGLLTLLCAVGVTAWAPAAATVLWICALETSPDEWLAALIGGHETIIAVMKAAGLVLALVMGLRFGARADRYNPAFAFAAMFGTGLVHGLYPGLDLSGSLRSLVGSAAPFLFGFVRLPAGWRRAVIGAVIHGPAVAVLFGALLAAAGLHPMYDVEQGALRLGASGQPPFLAGFTLIAIYAGLLEWVRGHRNRPGPMLAVNFVILVLTGARVPLALAVLLLLGVLLWRRQLLALIAAIGLLCLGLVFADSLHFIRAVDLLQLGEAADLSNRGLIWPIFAAAIAASPWVGWGVGAGKVIVPVSSGLDQLVGTNAAHDEYLRIGAEGGGLGLALLIVLLALWVVRGSRHLAPGPRWLMRAIMVAFALHSATDNTLIATTSSVLFIWMSAVFAPEEDPATETP
jgi:O-antigen ligase